MNKDKTVLVTGGAGFIGSHLCEELIKDGFKVICLDNLITGKKENIKDLLDDSNFKFIQANIVKPTTYNLPPITYLFHLASPASPVDYQNLPEETLLVNSIGTINVLNLAKEKGSKVLIASTSEVYGDPLQHPQKEEYWGNVNSFGPRSCYDESKRFAESATFVYLHKYQIDARIARIFNTYGPKMQKDDGRVVSNFINQAITNSSLTIYGDGKQTRSFCYVNDMVDGLKRAMFEKDTRGQIFNLGNPEEYTMIDLAKKVKDMTGSTSEIVFKPLPPDDPMQRRPDISKAKKILLWEPKVSVSEGLDKTIGYYKSL